MHPQLEHQLTQFDLVVDTPPSVETWRRFLTSVSQSYANVEQNGVLESVADLSIALRSVDTVEEMLPVLLVRIIDLVGAKKGVIALVESETGDLVYRQWCPDEPELVGIRYKLGEGIVGKVAATGEMINTVDLWQDSGAVMRDSESSVLKDILSGISLPLCFETETIGVLQLGSDKRGGFDSNTVNILTALTEVAGVALTRVRFRETLEDTVEKRTSDLAHASEMIRTESVRIDRLNVQLELRQMELETTNRQLTAANQARMRFLANMSHELRTPLNGILGITQALQQGVYGDVNEQQDARFQNVLDSGSHLLHLVNDLLSLARVETHQLELQLDAVDVDELSRMVLHMVQPLIDEKHLRLATDIPEDIGSVVGDAQRLRQVLVNLLDNACKFTPERGKLGFSVLANETEVVFIVRDSGIGIRPDRLQDVFEPFVQVDDDYDRKYEGTGLGLALVKRLVELHGGSVAVKSGIGEGSQFQVTIPRWRKNLSWRGTDHGGQEVKTELQEGSVHLVNSNEHGDRK